MGFTADLKRFSDKTEKNASRFCRLFALDLHRRIVKRSPVETGRFKANNQISMNTLPSESTTATDKNGAATVTAGVAEMGKFLLGDTIFEYNNLAYAVKLEMGGYPNPPKRGTWDKAKQAYVIQTINGYSKQAPQGVYRISAKEVINPGNVNLLARKAQK